MFDSLGKGHAVPLLRSVVILLIGFFAVACDQVSGPSPNAGKSNDSSTNNFLPDSTVRLVSIGSDSKLLPPGANQQPRSTGTVNASQPGDPKTEKESPPSDPVVSPYGCVMSTPNLNGEESYRYESVYAFFPEHIVEAADGKTREVTFQMNSRTAYTQGTRPVAHILRQARCRLPANEQASRLLRNQLQHFPDPEANRSGSKTTSNSAGTGGTTTGEVGSWSGVPVTSQACGGAGSDKPSRREVAQKDCVEWTLDLSCITNPSCGV